MTGRDHNRTLGILFLVYGGLHAFGLVIMMLAMLIMGGAMLSEMRRDEAVPTGFVVAVMIVALVISIALLIPIIAAGLKLLKEKPNARTWGIAASAIALLNIPFGTALGAYGLWFLLGEEGKRFYFGNNNPAPVAPLPPPQPGSWQQ